MGLFFSTTLRLGSPACKQTKLLVFSYVANLSLRFHGNKTAAISLDIASPLDEKEKRRQYNKNHVPAKSVITQQKTIGFLQSLSHRLPFTFHLPGRGHMTTISIKELRKLTFYG